MTEYKNLTVSECADRLTKIEHPVILCHTRPDADTVGSAKALSIIFEQLGKRAKIAIPEKLPERLKFIVDCDDLTDELDGYQPVAIDVASPSQLGSLKDKAEDVVLTIDHHSTSTPFSDYCCLPDLSSAAEVLMSVAEELEARGLIKLTRPLATALYTAISSDTGCFCFSSVSPTTHIRAARLISLGIDFADVNHKLFHTKSLEQIGAESLVGSKIRTTPDGKIAWVTLSLEEMNANPLGKEAFECAIDVVRTLAGVEVAITVKEAEEGLYKVSLRSVEQDVSGVAALFGGGGHRKAAGCSVRAADAEEAKNLVVNKLSKLK